MWPIIFLYIGTGDEQIEQLLPGVTFLYHLKISENRRHKKGITGRNGLNKNISKGNTYEKNI